MDCNAVAVDAALYRDFLCRVTAEDLLHFFESTREASHEVLDKLSAKILVPWPFIAADE
jgi:hypothetical protein